MSLPPALLKRLASRGLVKSSAVDELSDSKADEALENEEIIAEDYDDIEYPSQYDTYEPARRTEENYWIERMKLRIGDASLAGYKCCPNKSNIYHKCSVYCVTRWGNGVIEPSKEYLKRKARLLRKYSLPKGWKEVYDCGHGTYYFWNTANNLVSWLPPSHPKSNVTKSAAAFRRQLEEIQTLGSEEAAESLMEIDAESKVADRDELDRQSPPPAGNQKGEPRSQPIGAKKHRNRDLDKTIRQKEIKRNRDKISAKKDPSRDPIFKSALPKQLRDQIEDTSPTANAS